MPENPEIIPTALAESSSAARVSTRLQRKKAGRGRRILLIACGILGLLFVGWAAARLYFSDERLRVIAEEQVGRALGVKCRIGTLSISVMDLSVDLRQVSLENSQLSKDATNAEMVAFDKLQLDLHLWASLAARQMRAELNAEGMKIRINRMRLPDKGNVDSDRFTTNIHGLLENISNLPWRRWLTNVDWRLAFGSVTLERGEVQLTDLTGILGPCVFNDIQVRVGRDETVCKLALSFKSVTPEAKDGRFAMTAQANIGELTAEAAETLSFITNLEVDSDFASLDLPYVSRYYGVGGRGRAGWIPGAALDGKITLRAPLMSALEVNAEVFSPEILRILEDGKPVPGGPQTRLTLNGSLDCSQEWTIFQPLQLRLRAGGKPGTRGAQWLEAGAMLRGSLGDSLILTSDSRFDFTDFGDSSFGRVAHLDQTVSGLVNTAISVKLEKGRPLKFNFTASSTDLVFHTASGEAPAPLDVDLSGAINLDRHLLPIGGELSLNLDAKSFSLRTPEPFIFSFDSKSGTHGSLEMKADLAAVSRNFARPLNALGIGAVEEAAAGTFTLHKDGALACSLIFIRPNYGPVTVQGAGRLAENGAFAMQAALNQSTEGGVALTVKGNGKIAPGAVEANFDNQLAAHLAGLYSLRQRFRGFFGAEALPAQKPTGTIRQAARGRLTSTGDNFSLAAGITVQAENVNIIGGQMPWQEKRATLSSSLTLARSAGHLQLTVNQLDLNSSAGNLKASSGLVNTGLFSQGLSSIAAGLPAVQVDANLGPVFFSRIAALAGDSIPLFLREGKSLVLKTSTEGAGSVLKVELCRLQTNDVTFDLKPFTVDAGKFAALSQVGDYRKALATFSPVHAILRCGPGFWSALPLPTGFRMAGTLSLSAAYEPGEDRLRLPTVEFAALREDASILNSLQASVDVYDFSSLLAQQDLFTLMKCLRNGVSIARVDVSVPTLQAFVDLEHKAMLRALQGRLLSIRDFNLRPMKGDTANAQEFSLSARTTLDMAYYSADARWPLLALNGMLAFPAQTPLRVRVGKDYAGIAGTLDLTGAGVKFAALAPYVYDKAIRSPLHLSFSLVRQDSGVVVVSAAELKGDPLPVQLSEFSFADAGQGVFRLQLQKVTLGAPFNLTIANLLLDKAADRIRGEVSTSGIDFAQLSKHMTLPNGLRLSGSLGASSLLVQDRYQSFFGGRNAAGGGLGAGNSLKLGALQLGLSAQRDGALARMSMALDGGNADGASGKIVLHGLKIHKPEGFNYENPLVISKISIAPDTRTLFSDSLVINRLDISGLEATLELGLKNTNVSMLQKNMEALFPSSGATSTSGADLQTRKTLIKDLYIDNGVVKISQKLLMGMAAVPVPLPPLHMQNIGGDNTGSVFRMVGELLLRTIANSGSSLIKGLGGVAGGTASGTVDKVQGVAGEAAGLLGGFGKKLGGTLISPLTGGSGNAGTSTGGGSGK